MSSLENNGLGLGQRWGGGPGLQPRSGTRGGHPQGWTDPERCHRLAEPPAGPCRDTGQSWDTEPQNTLCHPAGGDTKATPEAWQGICRDSDTFVPPRVPSRLCIPGIPSVHQTHFRAACPGSCPGALLAVPCGTGTARGALPAPAVPGLRDGVTLLCYTPAWSCVWGQGCPGPDHPTTCPQTPRGFSERPPKQLCQGTAARPPPCAVSPSLALVTYEPLMGGGTGVSLALPLDLPAPLRGRAVLLPPGGLCGEASCPSPSV